MSSVASSAAATASRASCSTADTQFPTTDIYCGVSSTSGVPSNTSDVLSKCCKSAAVEQFNGDCGYYCLSYDQTVADLSVCLMDGGVTPSSIFCSGTNDASATGTPSRTATDTNAPDNTGAASAVLAPRSMSKAGLGMLGMVVVSAIAGALL
ncbi:hypothetical protein BDW02DRAFT_170363 [Decorospora gaudefroyi]|uniref:Uncharacterized protein n=1 Tax=Decorospora gaudefroyi TaxID=184978 RepID=A0A6A5JX26_9PLEO|nr:hypothetical protein BDW02DRAFT_170363 [Decorospora gaudefroyi]